MSAETSTLPQDVQTTMDQASILDKLVKTYETPLSSSPTLPKEALPINQQSSQQSWPSWHTSLLLTIKWLWQEGFAYSLVTGLMYTIYGLNLIIIGFALLFTWQWITDDIRAQNTADYPTRRLSFLLLWSWFNLELLFYAYQYLLIRRSQMTRPEIEAPFFSPTYRHQLFNHTRSYAKNNGETLVQGWFLNSQLHQVRRDNALEWLAWAFYNQEPDSLSAGETTELHKMLDDIQEDVPFATEIGRANDVKCMRLTFDPVRIFPRPLMVYVLIHIGQWFTTLCLKALGFRKEKTDHLIYWYRNPGDESLSQQTTPIVFVHGLSLGLTPYLRFFWQLCRRHGRDRPLVLLHLDHLTYRWPRLSIPSRLQIVQTVCRIFDQHQLPPAIWMGHSFGTIVCAWMSNLDDSHRYLQRTILIDPVCFQLWEPELIHNALYRSPSDWLLQLLRCVISSEHGIALTLSRHFWWYENILLPQNLRKDSHVILAEHDGIINSYKLSSYLKDNNISYSILPKAIHAQFIMQPSIAQTILELL
ncbi:hypothetical protein BDF19DRAFT_450626 [Syncephalis fuscata]|nr:hypothetical protein BDF19DRAFT_450626 [Syncephalis fuscata]